MYLKSIEVQGFKSFANKTVFQFHNGITGIVGPNGSGKSNVADAVRWVLGEQRVKQLRGGSMQDVIFAGTQSRKPLGYASVAITLDNSDHILPIAYDTVTVARRLYRSGESEYMLNGTQCRLKDVQELFYDTGIGKEGYSIIGQGQIERILSGKPEERRELFDEAAGIVKFKRRKLEAARKLEREQQNLLRVNDILSELTRQLGPLQRQSEKAKIYLKKKEELKAYDVNLFLDEMDESKERLAKAKEDYENVGAQLTEVKEESEQIRNSYEESGRVLDEIDQERAQLQEEITKARLACSQMESRIGMLEEQNRAAEQSVSERRERLDAIRDERSQKKADMQTLGESIVDLQAHTKELEEKSGRLGEAHDSLLQKMNALEADAAQARDTQLQLMEEQTQIRTRQQHFDTMLEQIRIQRAKLSGQMLELKTKQNDQADELSVYIRQCGEIDAQIEALNAQSSEASERLSVVQEDLSKANQQMEADLNEYHKEASRLETMRNIAERYDGYGSSIRRVMERRDREKGIFGVVADLIKTQKQYETAIETALGGSIQNIVTDNEETAKRMIEYLKQNRFGRATFLPLTAMQRSEPFKQTGALNEPGVIGLASTLVQTEPRYSALIRHLLGRIVVADNIDHAVALARKFKYSLRIVTLEGESLNPGGAMTGGAFKNSSNLLGRRREIEELQKQVAARSAALEKLREEIDQCRGERNALRDTLRDLSGRLQEKYLEKNTADMRRQEIEGYREQTRQTQLAVNREDTDAQTQTEEINRDREAVIGQLADIRRQEDALRGREDDLKAQLEEMRAQELQQNTELTNLHVDLAASLQKAQFLAQEQQRLETERKALLEERESIEQAIRTTGTEIEERTALQAQLRETLAQTRADQETASEKERQLAESREEKSSRQKEIFDRREELSQQQTLLDREHYRLGSQIERIEESRESRISYMWEEYELTLSAAAELRRDDLGSKTAWRRNMSGLKKEIRELGNVNVNAIEEYREVSERHQLYSTQVNDIEKAEKALQKIIAELDSGMRERFKEQFARIQEEFDKSFKDLFGGGQGSLELVEDEDILEAGIRIIAQPPGKKLQNMMQLSGGEKSLTAIALLFAIQNLKPSPFCLLDEIEAALDENNVDRYAQYLHKLTKHTQFIIITHRRGTMAAADRLYGVTMQEKGISALVSVSLIESELDK